MVGDLFVGKIGPGFAGKLRALFGIPAVHSRMFSGCCHGLLSLATGRHARGGKGSIETGNASPAGSKTGGSVFDPPPFMQMDGRLGISQFLLDLSAFTARHAGKEFHAQFLDVLFNRHDLRS
ncbi:hypothetical protein [Novosphingobium terrae]|uniref:hypothetical protein n=1 Tax=Novosphingobium terrae TaxID=2726189 RepID=UPI00197EAD45|nr:hypothetical protein [Novosphingobium terrae]